MRARYLAAFLLGVADEVAAQAGGLVGPGAMTRAGGGGGGGRQHGGWATVGKWPAGFFIAGSSIDELNGLYVPLGERDDTLPQQGYMTWGNLGSPWIIANVDSRRYPSLGNMPMEWVLYDEQGRARFAHQGGKYLPSSGDDWVHLHRSSPHVRRLVKGDQVQPRPGTFGGDEDGAASIGRVVHAPAPVARWEPFWPMPEDASARNKGPLEAEPVRWRRLSDGQLFKSAGWQLELLKASPELDETATTTSSSTGSAGGALAKMDDAEELPWQVVALMSAQSLGEYVDRWRDHDKEVRAAAELGASHAKAKQQQQQSALAGMLGAPVKTADGSERNADTKANPPSRAEVEASSIAVAAAVAAVRAVREGEIAFAWDFATAEREGERALQACQVLSTIEDGSPISDNTAADEADVPRLFDQTIRWLAFGREDDDDDDESESSGAQKNGVGASIEVDVTIGGESQAAAASAHSWKPASAASFTSKNRRFVGSPGAVAAVFVLQGECARNLDISSSSSSSGGGSSGSKREMLSSSALESAEAALAIAEASLSSMATSQESGRALQLYANALLDANRPSDAVSALEKLHAIAPQWPQLGPQLVNAHALARRLAEYRRGGRAPTSSTTSTATTAATASAESSSSTHSSSSASGKGSSSSSSSSGIASSLSPPPLSPPPLWSAWWVVGCGAPAVQGLARVGDLARTFDRVQGFWEPGDLGVVIGLGAATAPLALRMGLGPGSVQPREWASHSGMQANFGRLIDVNWGRVEIIPASSPEGQALFASAMAHPWNKQALGLQSPENQQRQLPSPSSKAASSLYDRVRDSLTYRSSSSRRNGEEEVNQAGNGDADSREGQDSETSEEDSNEIAAAEASGAGLAGNAWSRVDYYTLLNLPHDLFSRGASNNHDDENEEALEILRKAYRAASRRYHPDKQRGTMSEADATAGFQRVVSAFEVLGDPSQRLAYAQGADLGDHDAPPVSQGQAWDGIKLGQPGAQRFQGFSLKDEIMRHHFPAAHGWRAFGDPFERRRETEKRKQWQQQQRR